MEKIVVFKEKMLHASERFVFDQTLHIDSFDMTLVGLEKLDFINIESIKSFYINQYAKSQVYTYKLWGYCPKLISLLNEINPCLVHVHMGGDGARFAVLRNNRWPFIVTFHGTDATTSDEWKKQSKFLYHRQYPSLRKTLIKSARHFIAVSEYVKGCMIKQGYPKEKITVHYTGIDTEFFTPINCHRKKSVLFVGRLTELKGCHFLIQAMVLVQREVHGADLIVIGDGDESGKLEYLSRQLNVKVSFLGTLNREGIKQHLSETSVFCAPSITIGSGGAEGFGIVFLEAQSMGIPVVSFSSGGIPEAVIDGQTGFLYKEKDVEGLALGIITLLKNDTLWQKFSQNALENIRANFDIKKQSKKLEQLYRKIIDMPVTIF